MYSCGRQTGSCSLARNLAGKKMNKNGFTLVEIMIVVAVIGLLAAIGIPSILGAYDNSQVQAKSRNITEVEKAKGVLTLPSQSGVKGAMAATLSTPLDPGGAAYSNLLAALRITNESALVVGGDSMNVGSMTIRASYP